MRCLILLAVPLLAFPAAGAQLSKRDCIDDARELDELKAEYEAGNPLNIPENMGLYDRISRKSEAFADNCIYLWYCNAADEKEVKAQGSYLGIMLFLLLKCPDGR